VGSEGRGNSTAKPWQETEWGGETGSNTIRRKAEGGNWVVELAGRGRRAEVENVWWVPAKRCGGKEKEKTSWPRQNLSGVKR